MFIEVSTLWLSFMCVCMGVCMYTCVQVCAFVCICRSWRKTSSVLLYHSLLSSFEIGSVTELVAGFVASNPQWSFCFCSPNSNSAEVQVYMTIPFILFVIGDLNSVPYAAYTLSCWAIFPVPWFWLYKAGVSVQWHSTWINENIFELITWMEKNCKYINTI